MFQMFYLNRPDVLPTGDLGVRKGMAGVYGLSELPSPAKMVGPDKHVWRELFVRPYPGQLFTSSTVCETSSFMISAPSCDVAGIVSPASYTASADMCGGNY